MTSSKPFRASCHTQLDKNQRDLALERAELVRLLTIAQTEKNAEEIARLVRRTGGAGHLAACRANMRPTPIHTAC